MRIGIGPSLTDTTVLDGIVGNAIATVRGNIPDVTATVGTPVTINGTQWFTGANPAISAINVVGSLPAGVTQSGLVFTFDPASAGTVSLQVTATNDEGTSGTATIGFVGEAAGAVALALTPFTNALTGFSSNTQLGRDDADVPFEMTGENGQTVEGRVVDLAGREVVEPTVLGVISGGTLSTTEVVPTHYEYMTREVRYQGDTDWISDTKQFHTVDSFYWTEQSEAAYVRLQSTDFLTPEALISHRLAMENLAAKGEIGTFSKTTKQIDVDTLPTGVVLNAAGDAYVIPDNTEFVGWDMVDATGKCFGLEADGNNIVIENNLFDRGTTDDCVQFPIRILEGAGDVKVRYNTIRGRQTVLEADMSKGRFSAGIREEVATDATRKVVIERNLMLWMSDDGIKSAGAETIENAYLAPCNMVTGGSGTIALYDSNKTYAIDEVLRTVVDGGDRIWISTVNGQISEPFPTSKSGSNAFVDGYDPHADPINAYAVAKVSGMIGNLIDISPDPAYLDVALHSGEQAIGTQSGIYLTPNDNGANAGAAFKHLTLSRNVLLGFGGVANADPMDISKGNSTDWTAPSIYNNFMEASQRSSTDRQYIFIDSTDTPVDLGENFDADTDALITVPRFGTVTLPVVSMSIADQVEHVWLDINQGPNSTTVADIGTAADVVRLRPDGNQPTLETAALIAMTNAAIGAAPNRHTQVVHSTWGGTDFRWIADDAVTGRRFSNESVLAGEVYKDGAYPSLLPPSWFAAPGNLQTAYGRVFVAIFAGVDIDGNTVTTPLSFSYEAHSGATATLPIDHTFAELFDFTKTKIGGSGPHKFTPYFTDGNPNTTGMLQKERAREGWRELQELRPELFSPTQGLENMVYQQGWDGASPTNGGPTHPNTRTVEGVQMKARYDMYRMQQAAGIVRRPVPTFDDVTWDAAGAHVDVGTSVGDVTTPRLIRGLADIAGSLAHRTEIMSLEVDDALATAVTVVDGKARFVGPFLEGDTIKNGSGGGTGQLRSTDDIDEKDEAHLNYPVIAGGPYGGHGIPISPLSISDADAVAPAFTGTPPATGFTVTDSVPNFKDPADVGTGLTGLAFEFNGEFNTGMGTSYVTLMGMTGNIRARVQIRPSTGGIRLSFRDGTDANVLQNYEYLAGYGFDESVTIAVEADYANDEVRIYIDGNLADTAAFTTASNGSPATGQEFIALDGVSDLDATVEHFKFWKTDDISGTPFKTITSDTDAWVV